MTRYRVSVQADEKVLEMDNADEKVLEMDNADEKVLEMESDCTTL